MIRRLRLSVVLVAAALVGWTSTGPFAAWGDDVADAVRTVATWTPPPPASAQAGGIDFVECDGCGGLPGADGFGFGVLMLFLAGGPLAFVAAVLERRQHQFGAAAIPAAWAQTGFIMQCASVVIGAVPVGALLMIAGFTTDAVHWSTVVGVADIVFGVPALFTWRRLLARAYTLPLPAALFQ